jgi:anthranilate phosphoribosyltransferase
LWGGPARAPPPPPHRDIALLNAAAAMVVAGAAGDLPQAHTSVARAVDEGRARRTLEVLVRSSNAEEE